MLSQRVGSVITLMRRIAFRFVDLLRHQLIVGGTGSGKTNLILKEIHSLFSPENRKNHPCAVILVDPAGDASMDLARSFPDLTKVMLLDPYYVRFAINPLGLLGYRDDEGRKRQVIRRVDELKTFLADVMRTDPERASRLSWIFTGDLHYLYSKGDGPTFRDLYHLVSDQLWMNKNDVKAMLIGSGLDDKTIEKTLEGISSLQGQAFPPLLNRLSRFVLPENSLVTRTFCTRQNTVDMNEWLEPGRITVVRIPKIHDIPDDFRELLAATVVLNVYFAVQSRATRLEEEGKDPSARTPVFFFIDEFQTVEKLETLEVILSEARKFGLSLVLANQYTSQITNKSLLEAILQNAGVITVGQVSGDDAKLFARIIGDDFVKSLEENTTGSFTVKIKPYEVGGVTRTERWPTSKAPDYVRAQDAVITYMKTEMERKYGGAEEAHDLIYKKDQMRVLEESGRPKLTPLRWTLVWHLYKHVTNELMRGEAQVRKTFWESYGWNSTQVTNAVSDLMEYGYVEVQTGFLETIQKGKDPQTGQPIYGPPTTQDEKERSRVVTYSLTKLAVEEFFTLKVKGSRAGNRLHLLMMQRELQNYRDKLGYWCTVDRGEKGPKKPDIVVFKRDTKAVAKRDAREGGPDVWDYDKTITIECETNPRKHQKQLVENYEKSAGGTGKLLFVVPLPEMKDDVSDILSDRDPQSYDVEYLDVGLGRDRITELEDTPVEDDDDGKGAEKDEAGKVPPPQPPSQLSPPSTSAAATAPASPATTTTLPAASEVAAPASESKPLAGSQETRKAGPVMEKGPLGEMSREAYRRLTEEIWPYFQEHGRPLIDSALLKSLAENPNWMDDPIWKAAEAKAREREKREDVAKPRLPAENVPLSTQSKEKDDMDTAIEAVPAGTPSGSVEVPSRLRGAKEAPRRSVNKASTGGLTPSFKKKMVFVLNTVHGRDIHTSLEIAAAVGASPRQTLRYLNALVSHGFLTEEKKKYFLTDKGRNVLSN